MAIKNKDGSIVCFSKPNPIVMTQNLWSKDENFILEGKFGITFILGEEEEIKPVPIVEPIIEQNEEIKIIAKKQDEEMFKKPGGVIDIWCLPTTNGINYGEKFILKGKVYDDSNDFYIQVITRQILPPNSVIFPINQDRRWWQVTSTQKMKEEGFYLVSAMISDYQPNFS